MFMNSLNYSGKLLENRVNSQNMRGHPGRRLIKIVHWKIIILYRKNTNIKMTIILNIIIPIFFRVGSILPPIQIPFTRLSWRIN
jgi:hypothetical protein